MDLCKEDITIDGESNIETQLMVNPFFGIMPLAYSDLFDIETVCEDVEMANCDSEQVAANLMVIAIKRLWFKQFEELQKLIHESNHRIGSQKKLPSMTVL